MNWTELLTSEIHSTYHAAEGLLDLVDEDMLGWKPPAGSNWMTTGQLLRHLAEACGFCFRGFVRGEWGMPEGVNPGDIPPEEMLPPAEKMPAVSSVAEAKRLLAEDKKLAFAMLAECSEETLATKLTQAPWDPTGVILGHRLLQMVGHLCLHKNQLFYYLKLQGKPVHTGHLFGM